MKRVWFLYTQLGCCSTITVLCFYIPDLQFGIRRRLYDVQRSSETFLVAYHSNLNAITVYPMCIRWSPTILALKNFPDF